MLTVGIWLPIDFRGHWKGEGIARIVKYALEGATRLPEAQSMRFRLYVTGWAAAEVTEDLQSLAPAIASGQITIVSFKQDRWTWYFLRLLRRLERGTPAAKAARGAAPRVGKQSLLSEAWRRLAPKISKILLKPYYKIHNICVVQTGNVVALCQRRDLRLNTQDANMHGINVWWVPYVGAEGVLDLKAPIVAHFFDFMAVEYPSGWPAADPGMLSLYNRFRAGFKQVSHVIATSQHAVRDQLQPHFGMDPARITIIPNPYPSYYRTLVSSVAAGQDWPTIRREAGNIIQSYIQRGIAEDRWPLKDVYTQNYLLPYYASIDWASTTFLFAPTQDRPYKNLSRFVDLIEDLVRREGRDIKLVLTAGLDMTSDHRLARMVYERNLTRHVISLPRVPDEVHAALFAAASMSVHASYIEGGIATANFIEGLYLRCPAIYGQGPHTLEAAALFPEAYADYLFLPDRPDQLKELVLDVLENREEAVERQMQVHAFAQKEFDATTVVARYLDVFRAVAAAAE